MRKCFKPEMTIHTTAAMTMALPTRISISDSAKPLVDAMVTVSIATSTRTELAARIRFHASSVW